MTNYISRAEIEELCEGLIVEYSEHSDKEITSVDIDGFVKDYLKYKIVYETIAEDDPDRIGFTGDGNHPLTIRKNGQIKSVVYPPKTIVLDKHLKHKDKDAMRRFILAHEVGHILSNRIDPDKAACFYHAYSFDNDKIYSIDDLRKRYNIDEINANAFAAALLMPRFLVERTIKKYNGGRRLPVYGEFVFHPREKTILHKMETELKVSHSSLVIRLKELDFLKRHLLSEYIKNDLGYGGDG